MGDRENQGGRGQEGSLLTSESVVISYRQKVKNSSTINTVFSEGLHRGKAFRIVILQIMLQLQDPCLRPKHAWLSSMVLFLSHI